MAKTIATGPAPSGGRAALFGAALGKGFGTEAGKQIKQQAQLEQQAEQLNPMREALLENYQQTDNLSPMQAMIKTAAEDPQQFARLANDPQQLQSVAFMGEMAQGPEVEPISQTDVVEGGSERAKDLGVNIPEGEHARVEIQYDPSSGRALRTNVKGRFVTDDGGEGGDGGAGGGVGGIEDPFGSGLRGRALQYVTEFSPGFARGELNEEQERLFLTSVRELRKPETFTDPDTGLTRTRRGEVPDYAREAFEQRGMDVPGGESAQTTDPMTAVGQPGSSSYFAQTRPGLAQGQAEEQQRTERLAEFGGIDPQQAEQTKAQAVNEFETLPPDTVLPPAETPGGESVEGMDEGPGPGGSTLFGMAADGNITGPVPALARWASSIPFLGINHPEQVSAGSMVPQIRNRIVKALQTNPRYATSERESIIADLNLDPKAFDTPQAYLGRLVGLDQALEDIQEENFEVMTGKRQLVSGETRQHAMDTFQLVDRARQRLMPPRIESKEQLEAFAENNPAGTKFTAKDSDGNWRIWRVTPNGQRQRARQ